jgi:dihydroorotase
VAMPNTTPAIDCASVAKDVLSLGESAPCRVLVAGAITKGREGKELAPMAELAHLGVRMFTDDGCGVQDGDLMRRALEYAGTLRTQGKMVFLAQHCEETFLAAGGVMHDGIWAAKLGLPGVPSLAEEIMVFRDLVLSEMTGVPVHFLHLSAKGSVELVRRAKAANLRVSAEAAPHHFTLTDACVETFDPVFKVNPPLRAPSDVAAVKAGLYDGTIDAVATDHAPHSPERKDLPFDQAPPGMLGLETAFSLGISELDLSLDDLWALYSKKPAAIIDQVPVAIEPGQPGDICVFDEKAKWTLDPMELASKSHNSPYRGREFVGRVRHTICRGEPVVIDAQAQR